MAYSQKKFKSTLPPDEITVLSNLATVWAAEVEFVVLRRAYNDIEGTGAISSPLEELKADKRMNEEGEN